MIDPRGEPWGIAHVLIAVKDGESDVDALKLSFGVARKCRGRATVLYVIEVPQALALDAEMPDAVAKGELALQFAEQLAVDYDLEIDAEIIQARQIGPAIVDEVAVRHADLVVMTAHLHRRPGEFDMGKTVPYVLINAPCRVWVCRAPISAEQRNPYHSSAMTTVK
ncbi:MAG: universal stress protein [Candidatus Chloroheliales bacterium]|nr:MAG: universal stress protein [Chloroflexota bacterium]